jgi:hypothetical protein
MVVVAVRKTNISDHEISKRNCVGNVRGYHCGYYYNVLDSSGNLVDRRNSDGSHLMGDGRGGHLIGTKDNVLQPGESGIDSDLVGSWLDMSAPGTYTIQVSAHVSDNPNSAVVKSNIITVTVLPAKSKPPAESKPTAESEPPEESMPSADELDSQTTKQPFAVIIHAYNPQVKVGDPVGIGIEMKNISDHEIDCAAANSNGTDRNYRYEVLDEHGHPAPKIVTKAPSEKTPCILGPGNNAFYSGTQISDAFDFSRPGKYTIQLSRPIWGDDQIPGTGRTAQNSQAVVKSNRITITVLPAESKPSKAGKPAAEEPQPEADAPK